MRRQQEGNARQCGRVQFSQCAPVEQRERDQEGIHDHVGRDIEDKWVNTWNAQRPSRSCRGDEAECSDKHKPAVPLLVPSDEHDCSDHQYREQSHIDEVIPGEFVGMRHGSETSLRAALRHPEAERNHEAFERKAYQADFAVPSNLPARNQPRLPDIKAEPREEGETVQMVQCVELARPFHYREIVGDRKT